MVGYVTWEIFIFSTRDLIRWAAQVASGMAHLSTKSVSFELQHVQLS